jgi:hypothetical protein
VVVDVFVGPIAVIVTPESVVPCVSVTIPETVPI